MSLNGNPLVDLTIDCGLGLITFQDSQNRNRLNPQSLAALEAAFVSAFVNPGVKVVALRSGGKPGDPWCIGMDLDQLEGSIAPSGTGTEPGVARRSAVVAYGRLLELIATGPKPVIALVGGAVKAGGVGLAAACDIVLAGGSANFELSEVLFGLIPANVIPWLIGRRMSLQRCRFLILSAICLDAPAAQGCGLVDLVCADEAAESCLKSLLKTMMRAEPGALKAAKAFLGQAQEQDAAELRAAAVETLLGLMERPETAQAVSAFNAGGTPPWFQKFKPANRLFWRNDD